MKRVLTALVLIPIVLVIVFKAPAWVFANVAGVFGLLAVLEYLNILEASGWTGYKLQTLVLTLLCFAAVVATTADVGMRASRLFEGAALVLVLAPFIYLARGMRQANLRDSLPAAAGSLFAIPYIVLPMLLLCLIRNMPKGWFFILLLFVLVWSGDIFAYYIGKNFGKNKLAPRISPGKSVEGAIASIVGSILVGILLCYIGPNLEAQLRAADLVRDNWPNPLSVPPLWVPIVMGVLVNISAQVGDLAESMIKRGAGVKDSGNILPGHGGILDRIDALLFAVPVAAILFTFLSNHFDKILSIR
jgi:phosphatidate cytidylyltransferase